MQNLWENLVDTLIDANKENPNNIDIRKATNFLLGIDLTWEDSEYYKLRRNPKKLSLDNKSILLQKECWNLSEIISDPNMQKNVEQRLSECYKRTIDLDDSAAINTKIKQLVFLSIYGSIHPALFMVWNIKNSYKNCSNYVSCPEVIQEIQSRLSKNNILILAGEPAIGKTQVILEYIQKNSYNEAIWFEEPSSLKESLEKQLSEAKGEKILIPSDITMETALGEKSNEALIVIERSVLQKTDYDYINKKFGRKKLHIIVATRKAPCDKRKTLNLGRKPPECLYEIFKGHLSNNPDFFTIEEFKSLLQIIDSNTLVVALLGKALNSLFSENITTEKRKDITEKRANIKDKLLDSKQWIWKDKTLPPISHKNYRKESNANSIMYFIRSIISEFQIPDENKLQYAELALWVKGTMSVSALKSWCSDGILDTINEAIQLGVAEYIDQDKSMLEIHPFIADALWHVLIQKQKFKPIHIFEKNISRFLEKFKIGEVRECSYTMLYKAAHTCIDRIKMELFPENKRGFSIKDWRKLWGIMEQILVSFIECGNATMAEDIIQELYFYDCPINSDDLKVQKFDDKNKTKSASLYMDKIFINWMHGQDPQPLIENIPENVSGISYEYWHEEWIVLIQKLLDKIECGIDLKRYDNMYVPEKNILELFNCFRDCLCLLYKEYIRAGNPNDLHIGYYCGIFHYLRALYEYSLTQNYLDEVKKARQYYGQVHSQISDSDSDFRFIVIFSYIRYECCIFLKDLLISHPSIQDIQYWWDDIYNLFESTEREYNNHHLNSAECLSSYQKANIFIKIIQSSEKGDSKILVDAIENMRSSFNEQIYIDKRKLDNINAIYDNAITGLNNKYDF